VGGPAHAAHPYVSAPLCFTGASSIATAHVIARIVNDTMASIINGGSERAFTDYKHYKTTTCCIDDKRPVRMRGGSTAGVGAKVGASARAATSAQSIRRIQTDKNIDYIFFYA
jgi:hypothetical protein